MKWWIFTLMIFLGSGLQALDSSSVVKVTSGLCGRAENLFHGSGLVFSFLGKSYVLTSEHVIVHGNVPYCHSIWNPTLGKVPASLKIAEFGNGLALLALERVVEGSFNIDNIQPTETTEGSSIHVMGFAFSQNELISINPGRILVQKSTRKFIPLVTEMIETIGSHGEFGMSGGPVFNGHDELVGVLSHQYVHLIQGKKSTVSEFSAKSQIENHLLVIPVSTILPWVKSALKESTPVPAYFVRDPEGQLKKHESILSSGVRFELIESAAKVPVPVGGADGGGAGGADGAGAGGADGGGAGGADGAGSGGGNEGKASSTSVRLTLDVSSVNTAWYLPRVENWFVRVRESLRLPWISIEIPFFLSVGESIQVTKIDSLADFFQKLMRSDLEPVTLFHSSLDARRGLGGKSKKEEATISEMNVIAKRLSQIITEVKKEELPSETAFFLGQVEIVARLLDSNSWIYLKKTQLENLCNAREHASWWKPLFSKNFDLAVELLEKLNRAGQLLEELKA